MSKRPDSHIAGPSQRQLRVAEEIRHALATLFERRDFRDPDLAAAHVTVTEAASGADVTAAHSRARMGCAPTTAVTIPSSRSTQGATAMRPRMVTFEKVCTEVSAVMTPANAVRPPAKRTMKGVAAAATSRSGEGACGECGAA